MIAFLLCFFLMLIRSNFESTISPTTFPLLAASHRLLSKNRYRPLLVWGDTLTWNESVGVCREKRCGLISRGTPNCLSRDYKEPCRQQPAIYFWRQVWKSNAVVHRVLDLCLVRSPFIRRSPSQHLNSQISLLFHFVVNTNILNHLIDMEQYTKSINPRLVIQQWKYWLISASIDLEDSIQCVWDS